MNQAVHTPSQRVVLDGEDKVTSMKSLCVLLSDGLRNNRLSFVEVKTIANEYSDKKWMEINFPSQLHLLEEACATETSARARMNLIWKFFRPKDSLVFH